jgi:hypothetical protein
VQRELPAASRAARPCRVSAARWDEPRAGRQDSASRADAADRRHPPDAGARVARAPTARVDGARRAASECSERATLTAPLAEAGLAAPHWESPSKAEPSASRRLREAAAAGDQKESVRAGALERAAPEWGLRAIQAAQPGDPTSPTAAGAADAVSRTAPRLRPHLSPAPAGPIRVCPIPAWPAPAATERDAALRAMAPCRFSRRAGAATAPASQARHASAVALSVRLLCAAQRRFPCRFQVRRHCRPQPPPAGALRARHRPQVSWNASSYPTRPVRAASPGSRWV